MIDANLIKNNFQIVIENLKSRNYDLDFDLYESLESDRKKYQTKTENLQAQRKILSQEFGILKKEGKDDPKLSKKIESVNNDLEVCSGKLNEVQSSLNAFLLDIPNLPDKSVPIGLNEENNLKIREHGEPKILKGKDHLDITSMIDTESANLLPDLVLQS